MYRGEPGLDRLGVAAKGEEPLAQRLQTVQAQLAKPFALEQDPVVRDPVWQQLFSQWGRVQVFLPASG